MQIVAITRIGTSVELEGAALAEDLGTHVYDERLKLAAGCPAVVLITADRTQARSLEAKLRQRGHGVVACEAAAIVLASEMISLRRFRFEPDALCADDRPGEQLPWSDVSYLIRAIDRRQRTTVSTVKEKNFNLTRAIATGGLVMSKTTSRETASTVDETVQMLYLFRRSGETPWLLRDQGTHYGGLGAKLSHATPANFTITIAELRARAPGARFDDRLLARRNASLSEPGPGKVPSAQDLDVLAHLIAVESG